MPADVCDVKQVSEPYGIEHKAGRYYTRQCEQCGSAQELRC